MAASGSKFQFSGFSSESLEFLRLVREHNSRAWFHENREEYERHLLFPFQSLVANLAPVMFRIDPQFETGPAVDRTISRIHRDTRFSKDKSLYRDSMWLVFKRRRKEWTDAPAFFFEISPSGYRHGMGYYSASSATMGRFRRKIDQDLDAFRKVSPLKRKGNPYRLEGEMYRRPIKNSHPAWVQDWYQKRSFYLVCDRPVEGRLFSQELPGDLLKGFKLLAPLYTFLIELVDRE